MTGDRTEGWTANVRRGHSAVRVRGSATEGPVIIAWCNRWVLLACVVLSLALGFVYVQKATPIYVSTSRLYLDYVNITPEVREAGRPPQTDAYLYTQAALLKSRPVVAAAVKSLEPEQLQTLKSVEVPTAFVHKRVEVKIGRRDQIISVSFSSPHPVEAAQIVNQIVEEYMTSRSQHEQRNATQVLKMLQDEMVRAGDELSRKRDAFDEFQKSQMPLSLGSDQGGGVLERYLEIQAAHTKAQIAAMEAEAFLEGVKTLAEDPMALRRYMQTRGGGGANASIGAEKAPLETRLAELDLLKAGWSAGLTPAHPSLVSVASEVNQAAGRLAELDRQSIEATLAAARQDAAEAKDYEQQLAAACDVQRNQLSMANREVAQFRRLRSEVDQLTQYMETLEQQVREIRRVIGEDIGQLRMAILELALPAVDPSWPRKGMTMAAALVMGLLLGGGIVVAREYLDQTLHSVDQVSELFGLPVLGVVPAMSRREKSHRGRGQRVFLQPDSEVAEACRSVRTAIFFGSPRDEARTFLVTSPSPGDGKSTLVSNLAITMASAGQKTIIIDADLRKPTQHVIFDMDHRERSLSSVFARKTRLRDAIQHTQVEGLSLLACGDVFANPAEALNSPEFAMILKHIADAYDRVLVDAPPVTALADARIVAARCDYTLLVLRGDKTTRRMAQDAIESLQSVGARVLGIIINDVHAGDGRYGYYRRYSRYYNSSASTGGDRGPRHTGKHTAAESPAAVGSASGRGK